MMGAPTGKGSKRNAKRASKKMRRMMKQQETFLNIPNL